MKVRASVKKMSEDDIIKWRKPRGRGRKAKLYVLNKMKPKHKQRQG